MPLFVADLFDIGTYCKSDKSLMAKLTSLHIVVDYLAMSDELSTKQGARSDAIANLQQVNNKQEYLVNINITIEAINHLGDLYKKYCKPFAKTNKVTQKNLEAKVITTIIGDFFSYVYDSYNQQKSTETKRQHLNPGFEEKLLLGQEALEFTADSCFDLAQYFFTTGKFETAALLFDGARERYWTLFTSKLTKENCNSALNAREKCANAFFQLWKKNHSLQAKQSAIAQYAILLDIYEGDLRNQPPYQRTEEEQHRIHESLSQLFPTIPSYKKWLQQHPLPQPTPAVPAEMGIDDAKAPSAQSVAATSGAGTMPAAAPAVAAPKIVIPTPTPEMQQQELANPSGTRPPAVSFYQPAGANHPREIDAASSITEPLPP
jgi:hypothetical protein